MNKQPLFGKKLTEIQELVNQAGFPSYTAIQIAHWLYKKDITSFDEMSNVSKKIREFLKENYEFGLVAHSKVEESADGTKKYLFPVSLKKFVEAAYIPEKSRNTLCVSSQVGCKMACLFCMTGKQGFQGNLSAGEIVNQLRSLPERESVTNLVYMGMGEPFDNLQSVLDSTEILTAEWGFAISPRRITVSTIGIIPAMREFIDKSRCNLAISMHSPFEEERQKLMPIETVYHLKDILKVLKEYDFGKQRRVSFEYIMFRGINDTRRHVNELARILNGIRCRMNLIRYHKVPGIPLEGSDDATIYDFMEALRRKGIYTSLRQSRGVDISAACGLLSTKELVRMEAPDF
jgi:23S rRNA (adenine2503-C2)-methyltransferase